MVLAIEISDFAYQKGVSCQDILEEIKSKKLSWYYDSNNYLCILIPENSDCNVEASIRDFKNKNRPKKKYTNKGNYYFRETQRSLLLIKNYNISLKQYNKILEKQNGVCAICEKTCPTNKSLAVDHSHSTGNIRGLLCVKCNRALGHLGDDPAKFDIMAQYLKVNCL